MEDVGCLTRGAEFESLLLDRPVNWEGDSRVRLRETSSRGGNGLNPRGFFPLESPAVGGSSGVGENCLICEAAAGDFSKRMFVGKGRDFAGRVGGFGHESEHDLAVLVSDFLENGSGSTRSICGSAGASAVPDINHLAEKILLLNHTEDRYENDLSSVVHTLLLSPSLTELDPGKDGPCGLSCILKALVKLLRASGYDAALCISKWRGSDTAPGGEHEYIDVVGGGSMGSRRAIVDLDFRSHFEIARAVESYDAVLNSLPVVYVGSWNKLRQFLLVMAEAAKRSLKQNGMPLPPWRSLTYLLAKWQSKYERVHSLKLEDGHKRSCSGAQCATYLRRLRSSLQSQAGRQQFYEQATADREEVLPRSETVNAFFSPAP